MPELTPSSALLADLAWNLRRPIGVPDSTAEYDSKGSAVARILLCSLMRRIVLVLALVLPGSVCAQDSAESELKEILKSADQLANGFASCEGFFTFMSGFSRDQDKDAAAQYIKTFANGSRTAALWLLSSKYQADNPTLPPRKLGDFSQLVDGPAETERLRFAALAESGETALLEQQATQCHEMLAAFDPILQQFRQQMLGPGSPKP